MKLRYIFEHSCTLSDSQTETGLEMLEKASRNSPPEPVEIRIKEELLAFQDYSDTNSSNRFILDPPEVMFSKQVGE